jgi:hypothetical protein
VPGQEGAYAVGDLTFGEVLANLDAMTPESIRAVVALREADDVDLSAAWMARYRLSEAEAKSPRTSGSPLADRRRAAYLGGLIALSFLPRNQIRVPPDDGYRLLGVICE